MYGAETEGAKFPKAVPGSEEKTFRKLLRKILENVLRGKEKHQKMLIWSYEI